MMQIKKKMNDGNMFGLPRPTPLSRQMQNAIKLENISSLMTSSCFENLPLGIPNTHTYIPLMCVDHE
jgi:hypothetical protein